MRPLLPAPASVIDPALRTPRFGSYLGTIDPVDYGLLDVPRLRRAIHAKKWLYLAISTDDLYVAMAVVHLGYAANTFAYAFDRRTGRNLVNASQLAPAFLAHVSDGLGFREVAGISLGATRVRVHRTDATTLVVEARYPGLEVFATLDAKDAPTGIAAIAPLPGALVNTTQKRTLLRASGHAIVRGERRSLDGGFGGYDYTNGLLERHTKWKWAFLMGRSTGGEPVAMNLVEGFVGEAECALWIGGETLGMAEGCVQLDRTDPLQPWRVGTSDGRVALTFTPGDLHAERKNLGLIASNFIQAAGTYSGRIGLPGRSIIELDRVLGVSEDQDVVW